MNRLLLIILFFSLTSLSLINAETVEEEEEVQKRSVELLSN